MHTQSFISSLRLTFRNEEELLAVLAYSSIRRIPTSNLGSISVATSSGLQVKQAELKWEVNTDSLCVESSTAAEPSGWNGRDVTRLVATEHVGNKKSLLVSCTLYKIRL